MSPYCRGLAFRNNFISLIMFIKQVKLSVQPSICWVCSLSFPEQFYSLTENFLKHISRLLSNLMAFGSKPTKKKFFGERVFPMDSIVDKK